MMMYKPQPVKKPTNFKTLPLGLPLAAAAVGTVAALAFGKRYHVIFGVVWLALSMLHGIQHAGKLKRDAAALRPAQRRPMLPRRYVK